MKAQRIATVFVVLSLLAAFATAAPLNPYCEDPMIACEESPVLRAMAWTLFRNGFTFVSFEEQPIAYLVPPVGNYDWGYITFTFRHSPDGAGIETEYCTLKAEVKYHDGKGFTVDRVEAEFSMVY